MAVRPRDEILQAIAKLDNEAVNGIMEDIADSWKDTVDYENNDNPYKGKFSELQEKYRQRFTGGNGGDNTKQPSQDVVNGEENIKEEIMKQEETIVSFDSLFKPVEFSPRYKG